MTDEDAGLEQLFERLYRELRQLAHDKLRGAPLTLLETTGLVHECYERMRKVGTLDASERGRFLSYASRAMRSILVDYARQQLSARRGGGAQHVGLDAADERPSEDQRIVHVHEALEELERHDERLARVVEMRYFAGLTEDQIADSLGISERTVRRDWEKARMLLSAVLKA